MRGTGRTTKQIRDSPKSAIYVWCNRDLHYPREIAKKIGREDLEIVSPSIFDHGAEKLRGREITGMVIDHATYLNPSQIEGYDYARLRIRMNKPHK